MIKKNRGKFRKRNFRRISWFFDSFYKVFLIFMNISTIINIIFEDFNYLIFSLQKIQQFEHQNDLQRK